MTLAYQRAATPTSGWEAWGRLVYGTTRIPLRKLVVFGGISLLLLTLLIRTGEAGIGQLWASTLVALPLLALGSLTRTVGLRLLGRLVLIGVALVGVMYLLAVLLITPLLEFSRPRDFVVPAVEQLLVMAPLVVLVWRWRAGIAWSLGATDLLLAGVAVGIGFALVEESYIRAGGSDAYLAWLPVAAEDAGRIVGGHPIWAGLGGATLGLGLLLRSRGPIWLAVAASGSLLAFVDHAAHNNVVSWGDELAGVLNALTFSGWLPVLAFIALAAACIGADLSVQRRLESLPHREVPPRAPGLAGLRVAWEFVMAQRALAIADFHWRRLPEATRRDPGLVADYLDEYLAAFQPPAPGDSAPTGITPPASQAGSASGGATTDAGAPTVSAGGGGGMLLVLGLAGVALTGTAGLVAAGAAGSGALVLAALDVGQHCDFWCLLSGGVSGGASGGPGSRNGFVFAGEDSGWPQGTRLMYDDYMTDSDGNRTSYNVRDPRGGPNTWIDASDVTRIRPGHEPGPKPTHLRTTGFEHIKVTATDWSGARG